jgi:hypothetical protein
MGKRESFKPLDLFVTMKRHLHPLDSRLQNDLLSISKSGRFWRDTLVAICRKEF